jgi:hypothetical protein
LQVWKLARNTFDDARLGPFPARTECVHLRKAILTQPKHRSWVAHPMLLANPTVELDKNSRIIRTFPTTNVP